MLKKLFEGVDGLNDELIARMQPMFEAAVDQKSMDAVAQLNEAHQAEIEELREQLAESAAINNHERASIMAEKMDMFLERVVGDWINENSQKVQGVVINEAAAVFLGQLCEAANVFNAVIPESDQSVVDTMSQQVNKLEARLNDALRENVSLRESEIKTKKLAIAGQVSRGMSALGKERLKEAVMGSTYRDSKQFKALTESHRAIIEGKKVATIDEDDLFDDGVQKKSKQGATGAMEEEYVDGTDAGYPHDIEEDEDFFGADNGLTEDEDKDEDEEKEVEAKKEKAKITESVDMSVFKGLVRRR